MVVHVDAVDAHQAGAKGQEVPLGTGGLQHSFGVNIQFVENDCQLGDEGNVEIALDASMTLAASAALMLPALWVPAVMIWL